MSANLDLDTYLSAENSVIVSYPGAQGISGFIFDIPTGERITLSSDISEHYTENGSYVNDHIVNKPVEITLDGFIGELVYTKPKKGSLEYTANQITDALQSVDAYTGLAGYTAEMSQKIAALASQVAYVANQYNAIKKKATNLLNYLSGSESTETLQQAAYKKLYGFWKSKQTVSVQTPWQYYATMAIASIVASRDDKSDDYTDFSITLKEMRFADVETTTFDPKSFSAVDAQSSATKNIGKVSGSTTDPNSGLYDAATVFHGGQLY
jgi:hypothetical protein